MVRKKILFTTAALLLLSILPLAFAGTTFVRDDEKDLLLANDSSAPDNLQSRYSYLDITYASVECGLSTCTFIMTVVGTAAPATLDPQIKYVRYVWRILDENSVVIFRVFVDWAGDSGWFASTDAGAGAVFSWNKAGSTVTVVVDKSAIPSTAYRWRARTFVYTLLGSCNEGVLPDTAYGCPWFLVDNTSRPGEGFPWT